MQMLPLSHIRVLDFTWNFAGPVGTRILAILGAEVIKVETAARMDPMRLYFKGGPAYMVNCSKKSCTLNMSTERGRELAYQLALQSDVIAENFSRGIMDRFGLGYERLRAIKPDLIMLTSSGYGRQGPDADRLAFGQTVQAYTGLTGLIGYPGELPLGFEGGGVFTDPLTGITSAFALLAALAHRARTGEGQLIDIAMAEATMAQLAEPIMDWFLNGRDALCVGNEDAIAAPHNNYRCKGEDKWVAIAVGDDRQWQGLCQALSDPAWALDAKFADQYRRWCNLRELDERMRAWTIQYTAQEVTDILQSVGVPAGPALDTGEIVKDPQMLEREFYVEVVHSQLGPKPVMRPPWRLWSGDVELTGSYAHAPDIGQDNEWVLRELLGLGDREVEQLFQQGVIA